MKRPLSKPYMQSIQLALLAVVISHASIVSTVKAQAQNPERGVRAGIDTPAQYPYRYYALVIGNNDYQYVGRLGTAVNDAKVVEATLRDGYGFATRLLLNASRDQILEAINDYRRTIDENSNLLIYYAGHGEYDKTVEKAYWLPVDARPKTNVKWISADDVTTNIKGIPARHVLIISDSCYSGMLPREGRTGLTPTDRDRYLKKMLEGKSRILMSSGGNEPVADEGGSGHSIFARALLNGLTQINEDRFTAEELFYQFIKEPVAGKSDQTPQYNPIRNSGHDSGDFVFTRKRSSTPVKSIIETQPKPAPVDSLTIELEFWKSIQSSANPEDYRSYLRQYPDGRFASLAQNRINSLSAATVQPVTSPREDEEATYKKWYDQNRIAGANKSPAEYRKAMGLANEYLSMFPNGKFASYLKDKWKPQVLGFLFNEEMSKRNIAGMISIGQEKLATDPYNLDYLYLLSVNIRVNELAANPPNFSHAAEASDFTQRAIKQIEAGNKPTGVQQWNQNQALAYLYQTLAIIEEKTRNMDKALEYHVKAGTLEPTNAAHFLACGRIHQDRYLKATEKYQAYPAADRTALEPKPEVKATLEDVNRTADAVIDCWARFLGRTATKNDFGSVRDQVLKALITLYAYRHPDSPDDLQKLIDHYR